MKKKIFHNWGLKLVSLILAFMLWFVVVRIDDPQESKTFPNIPVELINTELLDAENKVYEVLGNTDTVRVTIRAPRSIIKDLQASDIVAEADMSKLTDINTIAISYIVSGVDSDSVRGDHDVIRLSVEDRSTRWIRVRYQTQGETAEDYMVAGVSLDQNIIEVTGPKSAVEQVSYACVEVDVSGATSNISLNAEPLLYDADGNLLDSSHIVKNVNYIYMAVEVLATKEVPIEVTSMGVPAEGYLATGVVESDVKSVKVAGTSFALSGMNRISIPAERMDLTGLEEDLVNNINLREYLPENVRFADSSFNGRVTVTAYVEPVVEKTLNMGAADFTILNVPEGYTATLAETEEGVPAAYELKISGLDETVSAVEQSTVRGTVDVAAWMQETGRQELREAIYEAPVTIVLPEGVTAENEIMIRLKFIKTEEVR